MTRCFCGDCRNLFYRESEYVWREFCDLWVWIGAEMRWRRSLGRGVSC